MSGALARPGDPPGRVFNTQLIAMVMIVAVAGIFVLYPVFYLLQAAFAVRARK